MSTTLLHKLLQSVESYPDSIAIVQGSNRVSYQSLWQRICNITALLHENKIRSGDRVAVLMENSPDYIATYYAALFAGGVVVALNTATKARDIVNWVNHCDAKYLFADAKHPELEKILNNTSHAIEHTVLAGSYSSDKPVDIQFHHLEKIIENTSVDVTPSISEASLATIIYTSGTTGRPKGVMLSHRNLLANIESILTYLKLTDTDSILNVLPFYYSYGNSVLHTHLAVGGKLVLENNLAFPHKILSVMSEENVTGFSGVPSTFALLMNRTKLSDYDLTSIRYMTQAGGAMAPANIMRLLEELQHVKFFVMYGQTEGTARLAYLPPERLKEKLGSIGIAIPGVTLKIVDENGNRADTGKTGEIYASGKNIMMGYWNDTEATKAVLSNGWLKTGDLAHYDDEGYIYIDGRSSDMIKSGANRISPKEIEEVISELDGISEVAVIGVPDELMGQLIKAVIVISHGMTIDRKNILAYCRENLAMYKVPKFIEFVDELPKTASGKVRRFLLQ